MKSRMPYSKGFCREVLRVASSYVHFVIPGDSGYCRDSILFEAHFCQLMNLDQPLYVLARRIDWKPFDAAFVHHDDKDGAPGKDQRLMAGLARTRSRTSDRWRKLAGDAGRRGVKFRQMYLRVEKQAPVKRRRKRLSSTEPKIGHLKSDNRMVRCFLKT